jgi:4-hydroxybenzoate polyprenyltransferase
MRPITFLRTPTADRTMSLRPWLQLCRFPAVFTALADILLGFLLVHRALEPAGDVVLLLAASAGLYLAGMVFNDVFDRARDAVERPMRPIPSGRVSLRNAVLLGSVLAVCGLSAAAAAGRNSLIVSALLTVCVFAYDGLLKSTPLGPVCMGGCRFLNVILGASSAGLRWTEPWLLPQAWIAAALGTYVAGVTVFARQEADRSRRAQLWLAGFIANAGLAGLMLLAFDRFALTVSWSGAADATAALLVMAMIALTIDRRIIAAIFDPSPARVQATVKLMLMSIITLDATLIYFKLGSDGAWYAVGTAALLLPAVVIGRWLYIT